MSVGDFDTAVETFRQSLSAMANGDAGPVLRLISEHDDVTLANPLGPPAKGSAQVRRATQAAASNFTGGTVRIDEIARYATPDLGYVVEVERFEVRTVDSADVARISLRVTLIFRREEEAWKVVHRHADPMTAPRAASAIADT